MNNGKKTKEELQKEANKKRLLRDSQIAQLKAQNQMLEEAKDTIKKRYGENSREADKLCGYIDVAQNQNLKRGELELNASPEEINSASYIDCDPGEIDIYNERMEKRGITDEMNRKKDISDELSEQFGENNEPTVVNKLKDKLNKLKNKKNTAVIEGNGPLSDEEFNRIVVDNSESSRNSDIVSMAIGVENEVVENFDDRVDKEECNNTTLNVIETPKTDYEIDLQSRCADFDVRDIPDNVMYDTIKLPSKGECYPHKKTCIPVAYMTAADENLIASPNLYNNGSLIDLILERKILDKTIHAKDLCAGDRDAIVIWLRATGYDSLFPVTAKNPETGKVYKTKVDLSKLEYKKFNLKGDEDGYFDYTTGNGDLIKFKMLTREDQEKLFKKSIAKYDLINKVGVKNKLSELLEMMMNIGNYEGLDTAIEAIGIVDDWANSISEEDNLDPTTAYSDTVTNRMIAFTHSVNGETNPAFIKQYIENMRTNEALKYRTYVEGNQPGMDLNIKVPIPESDGGGSFETFLAVRDTIFITV